MPKINRRESREIAFSLLFEWSFNEYELDDIIASATSSRDLVVDEFAYKLAKTAIDHHIMLDDIIQSQSENWNIGRISRVTLAALRVALSEIQFYEDIPEGVSINEAVELVKKYANSDDAAYLNGLLGAYVRAKQN